MSLFAFDPKAALQRARERQSVPTLPTVPTRGSEAGPKVGSVGTVGRGAGETEWSASPAADCESTEGTFAPLTEAQANGLANEILDEIRAAPTARAAKAVIERRKADLDRIEAVVPVRIIHVQNLLRVRMRT